MAMDVGGKNATRSDINVTPLVDVVLVLLIIFMVLTPLMEQELAVRVPDNDQTETVPQPPENQVVIRLFKDGRLYINKEQVSLPNFPDRVAAVIRAVPDRVAFFNAADDVPYNDVVHVLDLARGNGVATIGMVTEKPKDPALEPVAPGPPGAPGAPAAPGAPGTPAAPGAPAAPAAPPAGGK